MKNTKPIMLIAVLLVQTVLPFSLKDVGPFLFKTAPEEITLNVGGIVRELPLPALALTATAARYCNPFPGLMRLSDQCPKTFMAGAAIAMWYYQNSKPFENIKNNDIKDLIINNSHISLQANVFSSALVGITGALLATGTYKAGAWIGSKVFSRS